MSNLLNTKGNYITLTRVGGVSGISSNTSSWNIPFNDKITISTTQQTRQPIKEFFDNLSSAITEATPNGGLQAGASFLAFITDLFGVKFFNKEYYNSSWVGSEPSEISVKLHFFLGMNNKWSAFDEVYLPIMQIYSNTIPDDGTTSLALMTAPLPSTLDAFSSFGMNIVSSSISSLISIAQSFQTVIGKIVGSGTNPTSKDKFNNTLTGVDTKTSGGNRTWKIGIGYKDVYGNNATAPTNAHIYLENLIVTNSSVTFSDQLQKHNESYYPVEGDLNLTFKSQVIITTSDIAKMSGFAKQG